KISCLRAFWRLRLCRPSIWARWSALHFHDSLRAALLRSLLFLLCGVSRLGSVELSAREPPGCDRRENPRQYHDNANYQGVFVRGGYGVAQKNRARSRGCPETGDALTTARDEADGTAACRGSGVALTASASARLRRPSRAAAPGLVGWKGVAPAE